MEKGNKEENLCKCKEEIVCVECGKKLCHKVERGCKITGHYNLPSGISCAGCRGNFGWNPKEAE